MCPHECIIWNLLGETSPLPHSSKRIFSGYFVDSEVPLMAKSRQRPFLFDCHQYSTKSSSKKKWSSPILLRILRLQFVLANFRFLVEFLDFIRTKMRVPLFSLQLCSSAPYPTKTLIPAFQNCKDFEQVWSGFLKACKNLNLIGSTRPQIEARNTIS